ncbi:MAG: hypothetical protein WBG86_04800, partial [Polyangiales bacterium]
MGLSRTFLIGALAGSLCLFVVGCGGSSIPIGGSGGDGGSGGVAGSGGTAGAGGDAGAGGTAGIG